MSDPRDIVDRFDDFSEAIDGPEVTVEEFEAMCNQGDARHETQLPFVYTDEEWVEMNRRAA